jgi:TrmH family RNA methyltransferase
LPPASEPANHAVVLTKADVQRLRALREKKHREALGRFVVEGEKVVDELLAAGLAFTEIYATSAWTEDDGAGESPSRLRPAITRITPDEMARVSHFPTPSNVLAVGTIVRPPLPADALAHGLTLALDGVQDPGNVGTLLRIADWFAFDRVLLSPDCADLFHQKVINASMGSFARVRVHVVDLADALRHLAATSPATAILGCDLAGDDVHALRPTAAAVVVVGSEGRGLSDKVRPLVTRRVTIPRHGAAESLNAAVAAGIICDQLRRP